MKRTTPTERVTRFEVQPRDIKRCRTCDYGPLAWTQSPGGKWYLCCVYEQPDGRLMTNAKHAHLGSACESQKLLAEAAAMLAQEKLAECSPGFQPARSVYQR